MKVGLDMPVGPVVTALASEAGERSSNLDSGQFFAPDSYQDIRLVNLQLSIEFFITSVVFISSHLLFCMKVNRNNY